MRIFANAVVLAANCLCVQAALAHCQLDQFDRTAPPAIVAIVDDQFARFEWASDVDVANDWSWRRNYIFNKHATKGWSGYWQKADIFIPVSRPLPPGHPFCRDVLLKQHQSDPDTEAPIVYGTNNQIQPAAVYVEMPEDRRSSALSIQTYYTDKNNQIREVHLDVGINWKGADQYQFSVQHSGTKNLVVGISDLEAVLSPSQRTQLIVTARSGATYTEIGSLEGLIGLQKSTELFPTETAAYKKTFLFFSGDLSQLLLSSLSEPKDGVMAYVVLLDEERAPILGSRMRLPILR